MQIENKESKYSNKTNGIVIIGIHQYYVIYGERVGKAETILTERGQEIDGGKR